MTNKVSTAYTVAAAGLAVLFMSSCAIGATQKVKPSAAKAKSQTVESVGNLYNSGGFEAFDTGYILGVPDPVVDFETAFRTANKGLVVLNDDWDWINSGQQVVTDTQRNSGRKSLQLPQTWAGYYGGRRMFEPCNSGSVWVDFYILLPEVQQKDINNPGLTFYVNWPFAKEPEQASSVQFVLKERQILFNGKAVSGLHWREKTWTRYTINVDLSSKQTHLYIDGGKAASLPINHPEVVKSVNCIGFHGKYDGVYAYLDDITVGTRNPLQGGGR